MSMNARFLFVLLIGVLATASVGFSGEGVLRYPGNGLPILSKNKPVKELNEEAVSFFADQPHFKIVDSRIVFDVVPATVLFQSQHELLGPQFAISLPLRVSHGKVIVTVGDVEFKIFPNECYIYQREKLIYQSSAPHFEGISLERGFVTGDESAAVARLRFSRSAMGDYVDVQLPAVIKVEIIEGSSGELEPWLWLRGYK